MALVSCRECGNEVSTKAKTCPHCGIDKPGQRGLSPGAWTALVVVGFLMLAIYAANASNEPERPAPQATPSNTAPAVSHGETFHATGRVNVRSGPGTDFDVVNGLSRGQEVSLGTIAENGWAPILNPSSGQTMGYVLASLLSQGPAPAGMRPPPRPSSPPATARRLPSDQLDAAVRNTGTQIVVTNNDPFAWTNCTVGINAGVFSSGWTQSIGRIGAGETVAGGLMAFTRSNGERFLPSQYAVESVDVHCDTPRGRAHANFTTR